MTTLRRTACFLLVVASLFACEGATFRCDPSPSWSAGSDVGAPDDGGTSFCGRSCTAVALTLGDRHTCAAVGDYAEVVCFGANESGQSSPRVPLRETAPVALQQRIYEYGPDDMHQRAIDAGALSTCAVYAGSVVCWGSGAVLGGSDRDPLRVIDFRDALEIEHGALHVRVVGVDQWAIFGAWDGRDPSFGVPLDSPQYYGASREPLAVGGFTTWKRGPDLELTRLVVVARGGVPPPGAFGAGSWNQRVTSDDFDALDDEQVILATGALHACRWRSAFSVACRGLNDRGQLGLGFADSSPRDAFEPLDFSEDRTLATLCVGGHLDVRTEGGTIVIGSPRGGHTCALSTAGEVWCWGANDRGQLGDGSTEDRVAPTLIDAPLFTQLDCGGEHTCAIDETGELWCWGDNSRGQLGVPSTELAFRARPERVSLDVIIEP